MRAIIHRLGPSRATSPDLLAGGHYLPERMIALTSAQNEISGRRRFTAADDFSRLTDRQVEVLRKLATGRSNKEIARELGLSPATVKAHVAAVISALRTTNRTEAAFAARNIGLI